MDFMPETIMQYVERHSEDEPELLQQLHRETHQKVLGSRMISGHFQGRLLSMLSKLIQPTLILEIGTYTGYSALCLTEGLTKEGLLHTIDHNEELYDFQKKYFDKSIYKNQIKQYTGNALDIIPTIPGNFDMVFVDADKINYGRYFHLVIGRMNKGGVIISDNVLWSGKVTEKIDPRDQDTLALKAYNKLLKEDTRVETLIVPIRDGISISRVR